MKIKVGLERTKEVPVAWHNALWTIAPPSEKLSWLFLRWEAGDTWEPIERWCIWQMRPLHLVRPEIIKELKGPDPRSTGHYCAAGACMCELKSNAWRGGCAGLIDRQQWLTYRETGCYGTRWWFIQGDQGGHKHRLDETESRVSKLFGGPVDTPCPGDLPYADFDLRTFRKIAQMDKVRCWKGMASYLERKHDQMDAEEHEAKVEAQKLLWSWLESQTMKPLESITRKQWSDFREAIPRVAGMKDTTQYEEIQRDFIENPNS